MVDPRPPLPPSASQQTSAHDVKSSTGGHETIPSVPNLIKASSRVVQRRDGGVLNRGYILKTDHYPTGRALDLDLNITGAPNFRGAGAGQQQPDSSSPSSSSSCPNLGVYGVAQPTLPGLKTILSILGSSPTSSSSGKKQKTVAVSTREEPCLFLSGRPFVLREASQPFKTLSWAGTAAALEQVEERLKADVLREGRNFGGVILCHEETEGGRMIPTWLQVDEETVKTARETYDAVKAEGYLVDYHRVPISPESRIENNYLDAYTSILKDLDPRTTSVVINCGMGVVRTTFAMVAAIIIRRHQLLRLNLPDPFPSSSPGSALLSPPSTPLSTPMTSILSLSQSQTGSSTPNSQQPSQAERVLERVSDQHARDRSLLKLTGLLDTILASHQHTNASSLLASRPALLDALRASLNGSYQVILALLGCLEGGKKVKALVDTVVDACDAVTNLRDEILDFRVRAALELDDKERQTLLDKAAKALEKYFFLVSFAGFVETSEGLRGKFSDWLRNRAEIWNQLMLLRRAYTKSTRLHVFSPIADLSAISRASGRHVEPTGMTLLGNEWEEHIVSSRGGLILRASTLLKSDQWHQAVSSSEGLRGAVGFRRIPDSNLFAVGQPTQDAVGHVIEAIEKITHGCEIVWLNLREEPLVYVNGSPYCLRKEGLSLRNIKDYSGVSASRLEALELRLKEDVVNELTSFEGSLLLHTETPHGSVVPTWEEGLDDSCVASVREIMESGGEGARVRFRRLPMTSEQPPDFHDINELMEIVLRTDMDKTVIVLNDQLGRGRATVSSVLILLTQQWLRLHRLEAIKPSATSNRSVPISSAVDGGSSSPNPEQIADEIVQAESSVRRGGKNLRHPPTPSSKKKMGEKVKGAGELSWQIINNLLRVIRNGLEVKEVVDAAIDRAGQGINLRDCIEDARAQAAEATDPETRDRYTQEGLRALRRYFLLIVYQAYLDDTQPDTFDNLVRFEAFVRKRPVLKTFEKELYAGNLESLAPLARMTPSDGLALSDEVESVVKSRTGQILSTSTILKSDFFAGLQKLSLPDRIEGAPNYRAVPLTLNFSVDKRRASGWVDNGKTVYGTGMPTAEGLRRALKKMDAGPGGKRTVFSTSLREEPVAFIAGRPHVLRLQDRPLTNVEATGVSTEIVESMEVALKADIIREIEASEDGRILLHDEVLDDQGNFEVIPIWETVTPEEILTPAEVYKQIQAEGYRVDYARIAITDEQAPLPAALDLIIKRVVSVLANPEADWHFNCQMGRGRTTTGQIVACLVSSVVSEDSSAEIVETSPSDQETNPLLNGEYKTILSLTSVLQNGKLAKRLADRAIDQMQGVQNLRQAIYPYKLKAEAAQGSKATMLYHLGTNYLFRYGTLIVLADYLISNRAALRAQASSTAPSSSSTELVSFPTWLKERREIKQVLSSKTLD